LTDQLESQESLTTADAAAPLDQHPDVAAPDGTDPLSIFAQEDERDTESRETDAIPGGARTEPPLLTSEPPTIDLPIKPSLQERHPETSVPPLPAGRGFDTVLSRDESRRADRHGVVERGFGFVDRVRTYLARRRSASRGEAVVTQLEQRVANTQAQLERSAVIWEQERQDIERVMREARHLAELVSSLEARIRQFIESEQGVRTLGKAMVSQLRENAAQEQAKLDSLAKAFIAQNGLPDTIPVLAVIRRFDTGGAEAIVQGTQVEG
jgi:hypothetical protein